MNSINSYIILLCTITLLPNKASSQTCQKSCGQIPLKYPFGSGLGCGDPRFHPYITCSDQQRLTFATHTGCYTVASIDYTNQIIYISDPSMSTCSCTQPSKGFGLNSDAPFTFHDQTIFALLDCSTTSSPIYRTNNNGINSTFPLCDSQGGSICSLLYSCEAISRLSLPVSTCCVYTPVDLGPSFDMDLDKLHCTSYTALYGIEEGVEANPEGWKYGIGLKYKFNFNNDYPTLCASCEKSNGVCGYDCGPYMSYVCNCPGGYNTTTDCFYGSSWSYGSRFLPWRIGTLFTWFIILAFHID